MIKLLMAMECDVEEIHTGRYSQGLCSGQGTFVCKNESFEGIFRNYRLESGSLKNGKLDYTGTFLEFLPHGQGKGTFSDKSTF